MFSSVPVRQGPAPFASASPPGPDPGPLSEPPSAPTLPAREKTDRWGLSGLRAWTQTRLNEKAHVHACTCVCTRRHTEPRASYLPPAVSSSQPFRRGHTYQLLMLTDVLLVISPFPCQAERRAERAQAAWQDVGHALRAASFASSRVHSRVTAEDESMPLSASASPGQTSEQAGFGSYWEEESCKGSLPPPPPPPPPPPLPPTFLPGDSLHN